MHSRENVLFASSHPRYARYYYTTKLMLLITLPAFRNGDPHFVRKMFSMFAGFAQDNNIPREALQKQFEDEFGVPLHDVHWQSVRGS